MSVGDLLLMCFLVTIGLLAVNEVFQLTRGKPHSDY